MKDCWNILGIEETCDIEEIKKAYRELIKRYHPDTVQAPEKKRSYTDKVVKINNAYNEALEYAESVNSVSYNQYENPLKTEPTQTPTEEELWNVAAPVTFPWWAIVESMEGFAVIAAITLLILFPTNPNVVVVVAVIILLFLFHPIRNVKDALKLIAYLFCSVIFGIVLFSPLVIDNALKNWHNSHSYDKAMQVYDKAIELNPKDAKAYYNRGDAYTDKDDTDKDDYDKAIKDYDKAIELNPEYAEAYAIRGDAYYVKGNYDKAIKDYTKAIELNPKLAEAYAVRGLAYHDKGDHDQAINDYDKAIELNPKYASAYAVRGLAYHDKGSDEKAKEDLKKAADLGNSDARKHLKEWFNISKKQVKTSQTKQKSKTQKVSDAKKYETEHSAKMDSLAEKKKLKITEKKETLHSIKKEIKKTKAILEKIKQREQMINEKTIEALHKTEKKITDTKKQLATINSKLKKAQNEKEISALQHEGRKLEKECNKAQNTKNEILKDMREKKEAYEQYLAEVESPIGSCQIINTSSSPNGKYKLIYCDAHEYGDFQWRRVYIKGGQNYTFIDSYNDVSNMKWSKDSTKVTFKAQQAIGPHKIAHLKIEYYPAKSLLRRRVIKNEEFKY